MARERRVALAVLAALAGAWAEGAELRIAHDPHPCLLSGQFARIEARVEPEGEGARARVFFRSDGDARFYAVPMRREGSLFVGVLPSPEAGTTRVHYYITAELHAARARAPLASAFLADVVQAPCAEGAFAVSAAGPGELGVPRGAPQAPPGFERRGIGAFVDLAEDEPAAPARTAHAAPLTLPPIAPGSRIRVVARPGSRWSEGTLKAIDGETLVLDQAGKPLRVPRGELERVEVHEGGSGGMRALGGLIGGVAGVAVTALICASSDCESVGVLWVGLGAGAAVGAAVSGGGSWKPVTLASAGPVALDLRGRREGASMELRVGF